MISAESISKKTGIKYDRMIGLFLVDKRLSNKLSWMRINSLDALYKYIKNPKIVYEWRSDTCYMPDFSERDITKLNKLMWTDLFLVYNRLVTRDIYNRILEKEKDLLLKRDKYMKIVSSIINLNNYYEYDNWRGLYISEKGIKAIKEEVKTQVISDLITNMIKEEQE